MESLGTGTSPTLNVRVTAVRKAQVQRLAAIQGVLPADVVRDAVADYIKRQMDADPIVRSRMLSVARSTAE